MYSKMSEIEADTNDPNALLTTEDVNKAIPSIELENIKEAAVKEYEAVQQSVETQQVLSDPDPDHDMVTLPLFPAQSKQSGGFALEAMAARSIVISTNAGGIPEINIDGVTGFMANVGDVATMAKQAIAVLKDEVLLAKMKEQAYEQACKFDIQNIIPIYEKMYSKYCRMDQCEA
jgi:hypothetical protein